jgi:methionyl-tRNA formyltransferase
VEGRAIVGSEKRIVLFTNKSARGAAVLQQLKQTDIPIAAIIIDTERWNNGRKGKKLKRTLKRVGMQETIRLLVKRTKRWIAPKEPKTWQNDDYYERFSDAVYMVENFNGEDCERILRALEPDLIVLGGARIIRENIIAIPTVGILNVHPGLLPKYRGVDVIPWAIHNGDPVGVTVHFIDSGVDTGAIVAQNSIPISPGDTFGSLMRKANHVGGKLVASVVLELLETGQITSRPQSEDSGQQYYRMPVTLRRETEKRLKRMASRI